MSYFSDITRQIQRWPCSTGIIRTFAAIAIALSLSLFATNAAIAASNPLVIPAPPAASEGPSTSAATLFTANCAGCHANGGNVVRRGKTLKQKALKRYGYDNVASIEQIITNGRGIMSAYGDRLTGEEISAIAQYVKAQSQTNWK